MRWLDLFSGIGMYALGLEQSGHEVVGFCERDKFCQKILKKHWPMKPISFCVKLLREKLMESLEVSHAKTSQLPEKIVGYNGTPPERPRPVQDSSGRWLESFAWFDLNTGLWRTWQGCLMDTWAPYSEKWPAAGMMQNGIAWQRQPLAHPTIAPESTFLRTMGAVEGNQPSRERYTGNPSSFSGGLTKMLRNSRTDAPFIHPNFAEAMFGLERLHAIGNGNPPCVIREITKGLK